MATKFTWNCDAKTCPICKARDGLAKTIGASPKQISVITRSQKSPKRKIWGKCQITVVFADRRRETRSRPHYQRPEKKVHYVVELFKTVEKPNFKEVLKWLKSSPEGRKVISEIGEATELARLKTLQKLLDGILQASERGEQDALKSLKAEFARLATSPT